MLIGQPGTGKSHVSQAIGRAAIQQGYRVLYRETHTFLEELAEATLAETRKDYLVELARAHLLIIDDLGMRKLPHTPAEDLLELIMRRYELTSVGERIEHREGSLPRGRRERNRPAARSIRADFEAKAHGRNGQFVAQRPVNTGPTSSPAVRASFLACLRYAIKDSDRYKFVNFIGVSACNSIPHEIHRGLHRGFSL